MTTIVEMPAPRAPSRHRRLRRALIALGVVAVVIGLVWLVLFSSVLAASSVRVAGATGQAADDVLAVADVPMGTPLARLDTAAIGDRVLSLPWVGDVEVRRGYPSEVVIAVSEKQAVGRAGNGPRAVALDGTVFTPGAKLPADLVTITGPDDTARAAAAQVVASLPEPLSKRVVAARATTRDDVVLTMRSGAKVTWGSAEDSEIKAQVLEALLQRKARGYDVSAPELPTTVGEKLS